MAHSKPNKPFWKRKAKDCVAEPEPQENQINKPYDDKL